MTDLCAAWRRKTQCIRNNGIPSLVHMTLATERVQHTQLQQQLHKLLSGGSILSDIKYKTNLQGLTQSTQLTSVV